MQGVRLTDGTDWSSKMQPGEYCKFNNKGLWIAMSPLGNFGSFDSNKWAVTEHDDGTITVTPSLWFDSPKGWHGFLTRGQWVTA